MAGYDRSHLKKPFGDGEIAGNPAGTVGLRRDDGAGASPIEFGAPPIVGEGRVAEQSVDLDPFD